MSEGDPLRQGYFPGRFHPYARVSPPQHVIDPSLPLQALADRQARNVTERNDDLFDTIPPVWPQLDQPEPRSVNPSCLHERSSSLDFAEFLWEQNDFDPILQQNLPFPLDNSTTSQASLAPMLGQEMQGLFGADQQLTDLDAGPDVLPPLPDYTVYEDDAEMQDEEGNGKQVAGSLDNRKVGVEYEGECLDKDVEDFIMMGEQREGLNYRGQHVEDQDQSMESNAADARHGVVSSGGDHGGRGIQRRDGLNNSSMEAMRDEMREMRKMTEQMVTKEMLTEQMVTKEMLNEQLGRQDAKYQQESTKLRDGMQKNYDEKVLQLERNINTRFTKQQNKLENTRQELVKATRKGDMHAGIADSLQERTRSQYYEMQREKAKLKGSLTEGAAAPDLLAKQTSTTQAKYTEDDRSYRVIMHFYNPDGNPVHHPWDVKSSKTLKADIHCTVRKFDAALRDMAHDCKLPMAGMTRRLKAQIPKVKDIFEMKDPVGSELTAWLREVNEDGHGKGGSPVILHDYYYDEDDEMVARIAFSSYWV